MNPNQLADILGISTWPDADGSDTQDDLSSWVDQSIHFSHVAQLCREELRKKTFEEKRAASIILMNLLKANQLNSSEIALYGSLCEEIPFNFNLIARRNAILQDRNSLGKAQKLLVALALLDGQEILPGIRLICQLSSDGLLSDKEKADVLIEIMKRTPVYIEPMESNEPRGSFEDLTQAMNMLRQLVQSFLSLSSSENYISINSDSSESASDGLQIAKRIIDERLSSRYFLPANYQRRKSYTHYDDSLLEDEWQLEVYEYADAIMKKEGYRTVIDFGCGSGFKLIEYLGEYDTIGIELEENIQMLNNKYPQRKWKISAINQNEALSSDLLICSDVIEHLVHPDEFLMFLKKQDVKHILFSTPERVSLCLDKPNIPEMGPPANKAHTMEWTFKEFYSLISYHFIVENHLITNSKQRTQAILCRKAED